MSEEPKQLTAEQVRAAFPTMIAVADEFRAAFGDGVRIVYIKEGDRELGTRTPAPVEAPMPPKLTSSVPTGRRFRDG